MNKIIEKIESICRLSFLGHFISDKENHISVAALTYFTVTGIIPLCLFGRWLADFLNTETSISILKFILPSLVDFFDEIPKIIEIRKSAFSWVEWIVFIFIIVQTIGFFNNIQNIFNVIWKSKERNHKYVFSLIMAIICVASVFIFEPIFLKLNCDAQRYVFLAFIIFLYILISFKNLPHDKEPCWASAVKATSIAFILLLLWSMLYPSAAGWLAKDTQELKNSPELVVPLELKDSPELEMSLKLKVFPGLEISQAFPGLEISQASERAIALKDSSEMSSEEILINALLFIFWLFGFWYILIFSARVCAHLGKSGAYYMKEEIESLSPGYKVFLSILTASYVYRESGESGLTLEEIRKGMFKKEDGSDGNEEAYLPMPLLNIIIKDLCSQSILIERQNGVRILSTKFTYKPKYENVKERVYTLGEMLRDLLFFGCYDFGYQYEKLRQPLWDKIREDFLKSFSSFDKPLSSYSVDLVLHKSNEGESGLEKSDIYNIVRNVWLFCFGFSSIKSDKYNEIKKEYDEIYAKHGSVIEHLYGDFLKEHPKDELLQTLAMMPDDAFATYSREYLIEIINNYTPQISEESNSEEKTTKMPPTLLQKFKEKILGKRVAKKEQ